MNNPNTQGYAAPQSKCTYTLGGFQHAGLWQIYFPLFLAHYNLTK